MHEIIKYRLTVLIDSSIISGARRAKRISDKGIPALTAPDGQPQALVGEFTKELDLSRVGAPKLLLSVLSPTYHRDPNVVKRTHSS